MLEFSVWRDLCVAFVRAHVPRLGWRLERVRGSKSSRSVYLALSCGSLRAEVRLSDHRPATGAAGRAKMFSVRQGATGRLSDLDEFLAFRARGAAPENC